VVVRNMLMSTSITIFDYREGLQGWELTVNTGIIHQVDQDWSWAHRLEHTRLLR
jgi:hypothetical protein